MEVRTIYLDAVSGRGDSLIGVTFEVRCKSVLIASVIKRATGKVKVQVSPPDQTVSISASYRGIELPPVTLTPARTDWTFEFALAEPPKVLLVCALPLEAQAVIATLDAVSDDAVVGPRGDPNLYRHGSYVDEKGFERRVLLATSGMGLTNAAILTIHAMRSFQGEFDYLIMVGIAGGCPNPERPSEHVRLGDVVVLDERGVIQYDFIKRTIAGDENRAYPQRPASTLLNAVRDMEIISATHGASWRKLIAEVGAKSKKMARPSARSDVLHIDEQEISHPAQPMRLKGEPMVHRGAIGSANILLKDPDARDRLRDRWHVRAIEMEGSGVHDAAWSMNQDIMIVRGVCDYCDDYKNDKWQPYAALAAAAYTRGLVENLPADLFL